MKRILLVGLGNPGSKFEGTRHNIGIEAIRTWVKEVNGLAQWKENPSFLAELSSVNMDGTQIDCMFPITFMNDVGRAVAAYVSFYKLDPRNVVIIHDELELPLGEVVVKEEGSAHGHNGVRSIHQALGADNIHRVRIGIGRPMNETPVNVFVLQQFLPEERAQVETALSVAVSVISDQVQQLTR